MSQAFYSTNKTTTLAYTTAAGNTQIASAAVLNIVNPDTANVVWVSAGYSNVIANASTGTGTVIAPSSTAQLRFQSVGATGNIYISVIGGSTSGNIYITPGVI